MATPLADDFRAELDAQLRRAKARGADWMEINSGELHRKVGGYPGPNHRMPLCCEVMRARMQNGDSVLLEPPSGAGASLTIRYLL